VEKIKVRYFLNSPRMFHVPCIDQMHILLKTPKNLLESMNVILLHRNHRHVSATHVANSTITDIMCWNG